MVLMVVVEVLDDRVKRPEDTEELMGFSEGARKTNQDSLWSR